MKNLKYTFSYFEDLFNDLKKELSDPGLWFFLTIVGGLFFLLCLVLWLDRLQVDDHFDRTVKMACG